MADIENRKIIIRRGPAWDLPGKPTSIVPLENLSDVNSAEYNVDDLVDIGTGQELFAAPTIFRGVFSKGLDEGEIAFSDDEGRIFVGSDPSRGLPQFQRLQYPYQNVEILGENSVDAFTASHGATMREGGIADYYYAPLYPTTQPSDDQQPDRFVVETMPGFFRYGVESNNIGSLTATRDVDASMVALVSSGVGTALDPTRTLMLIDFTKNRMIMYAYGYDIQRHYTIEVRDTYGVLQNSYAVLDANPNVAPQPSFEPVAYTTDGTMAGITYSKGMCGIGIYSESGINTAIKTILYGTYDSTSNTTALTDTVSAPGNISVVLGPNLYNGVTYYCFGDTISVGVMGNYIIASCASVSGESTDPSSFVVFSSIGLFVSKVAMPPAYIGTIANRWLKAGSSVLAEVHPSTAPSKIHFIRFTPNGNAVNSEIIDINDLVTLTLAPFGSPVIDYYTYDVADDSLILFSSVHSASAGGTYYSISKWSITTRQMVWTTPVSTLVPDFSLPPISNTLWRSPPNTNGHFSDNIIGLTFKWLTNIGFHILNLADGTLSSAAWGETSLPAPTAGTLAGSPFFYDEAQDRVLFGGALNEVDQYSFTNNSPAVTSVVYQATNYVLGGDELTSKLSDLTSPDGTKTYVVNVNGGRWVSVYDSISLAFITSWDGGGTVVLGGTIVPCMLGLTIIPAIDGSVLNVTVDNSGTIAFAVAAMVSDTGGRFGLDGMYFHDKSDNSLVVIGGPVNSTTGRSFKWSLFTNEVKWTKSYSGIDIDTGEGGLPNTPPSAAQMINGGFFGFINPTGLVSLIDLSTGTRVYKGLSETTDGVTSNTPWGYSQWTWESATNTLIYVNSQQLFATTSATPSIADQLSAYTGAEPYLDDSTSNYHVDFIRLQFQRNALGVWSLEVSRPLAATDPFAPDMRLWADYTNRFLYMVSNGALKCYDLDTLEWVASSQPIAGQSVLKLWGSNTSGKLYIQYGSHDGYDGTSESYSDATIYNARLDSLMSYTSLYSINLFGRHFSQGATWKTVCVNGNADTPYAISDIDSVSAFIDYSIFDSTGNIIRHGKQHLQYFYNPFAYGVEISSDTAPLLIDEAEAVRLIEQDPDNHPEYDPLATIGQLGFRFELVDDTVDPQLWFQYHNYTTSTYTMSWRVSRPDVAVPARGIRGYIDADPITIQHSILGGVGDLTGMPQFQGWYWRVWYHVFRTGGDDYSPVRTMGDGWTELADDAANWKWGWENRVTDYAIGTPASMTVDFAVDTTGDAVCSLVYDANGYCSYEILVQHWSMATPAPVTIAQFNALTGQHSEGFVREIDFNLSQP